MDRKQIDRDAVLSIKGEGPLPMTGLLEKQKETEEKVKQSVSKNRELIAAGAQLAAGMHVLGIMQEMRPATDTERKSVADYVGQISRDTGVCFCDQL